MKPRVTWFVVGGPGSAELLMQAGAGEPMRLLRFDHQEPNAPAEHVVGLLEHGARESMYDRLVLVAELEQLGWMRAQLGALSASKLVMTSTRRPQPDQSIQKTLHHVMLAS